jgi:hypothetical protein
MVPLRATRPGIVHLSLFRDKKRRGRHGTVGAGKSKHSVGLSAGLTFECDEDEESVTEHSREQ